MLYSNFTTEAVQYSLESKARLYVKEMQQEGITVKVDEVGLLQSKDKPFLVASLDGIVTNLTDSKPNSPNLYHKKCKVDSGKSN